MANYQLTKDCLKLLKWLIIGYPMIAEKCRKS